MRKNQEQKSHPSSNKRHSSNKSNFNRGRKSEFGEQAKPSKGRFDKDSSDRRGRGRANTRKNESQPRQHSGKRKGPKPRYIEEMPLNKFIAHSGVCSRRDAVNLVKEGKVQVNGTTVLEPGFRVTYKDRVTLEGKPLRVEDKKVYILLNKPKGYITTTEDPKGRRTVMDIFRRQIKERIYPVGRLDRNTTGLLLLTNDGDLSQKLAHPKYEVKKLYQVTLDKALSKQDLEKIKKGLVLEDGPIDVDEVEVLDQANFIGIEIHSGRNRIVRRIFESLGYEVKHLDRVMYSDLTKKNLPRGKWRMLTKQEVINLKFIK